MFVVSQEVSLCTQSLRQCRQPPASRSPDAPSGRLHGLHAVYQNYLQVGTVPRGITRQEKVLGSVSQLVGILETSLK